MIHLNFLDKKNKLEEDKFKVREFSTNKLKNPNDTYSEPKTKNKDEMECTELQLGLDSKHLGFVVGKKIKGMDKYLNLTGPFENDRFIGSLAQFVRTVGLHVFDTSASMGDHCSSLFEKCGLPPFNQLTAGFLKKFGMTDGSFVKHATFGQADDQVTPCINKRREAQKFLYAFFMQQIKAAEVTSIQKRESKEQNNLFKQGLSGFVITLDIPFELGEVKAPSLKCGTLRYVIFVLDLKLKNNPNNEFVYWQLLSIYDVDTSNPMTREQIKAQKLTKTNLSKDEFIEALDRWDRIYEGCVKHGGSFGQLILDRLPSSERNYLEKIQTSTANVVRVNKVTAFGKYLKKKQKGK